MVRNAFVLAMLVVALSGAGAQQTDHTITVAVFSGASPAVFADEQGHARGIYPEILERLFSDLGYQTVFVTGLTFNEAYDAVRDGRIDIMPALIRTPAREKELTFSAVPLLTTWSQVFVRTGSEIESVTDLRNRNVALQTGGQNGKAFIKLMAAFGIPFRAVQVPDLETASAALRAGDADAMVSFNAWYRGDAAIHPTSIVFAPSAGYLASAKGSNLELFARVDSRLSELKQNESSYYHAVIARWLSTESTRHVSVWLVGGLIAAGVTLVILGAGLGFARSRARLASRRLAQSEIRFRTIFEASADAIVVYRISGRVPEVIQANPAAVELAGYAETELVRMDVAPLIAEFGTMDAESIAGALKSEGNVVAELNVRRGDGSLVPLEANIQTFVADGEEYAVVIARDIRERLAHEQRLRESLTLKETLLREIHHRVKNNLQTISSLLNIKMLSTENAELKASFREMSDRVFAMGLLHRMLYQNDDFETIDVRDYAQMLAHQILASHADAALRVRLDLDAVSMPVDLDVALPLGLIINEAIVNALKHGFVADRSGTVRVVITRQNGTVEVVIEDDGVGIHEDAGSSEGIGLRMITMLAEQLRGTAQIGKGAARGTVVHITFPGQDEG